MNKYLIIWFKSGAAFGVSMGVFFTFQSMNYIVGSIAGLVAGVVFGGSMAGITFFSDHASKKSGITTNSSEVNHTESVLFNSPCIEIKPEISNAISLLRKPKVMLDDSGSIHAQTGATWKSFGEKIEIKLLENNEGKTLVTVNSKPSLKVTVVDYGKNYENVKIITNHLKNHFTVNA